MNESGAIFDAHFHVVDPRFPLVANQGYLPPPFTVADYLDRARKLGVFGGAVVSGSFQATDQTYLVDALTALGPAFVGVTQVKPAISDAELLDLDRRGVRAIRLNLRRGGSAGANTLETLARRVYDLAGWHIEVYAGAEVLADILPVLKSLPKVVVDHLGLSDRALPALLTLAEGGGHVKASGFGRVSGNVSAMLAAIADADPAALIFGSDLPSTRAPRPFLPSDIDLVRDALGPANARRALHDNALALYRPRKPIDAPVP